MRSQGAIIFLACHTRFQAQKSAGGMFQQAGFPTVWLVPCRCHSCLCREVLFPVGTDGHQCSGSSHASPFCSITWLCLG